MALSEGHLEVLCNTLLKELKEKNIPHNLGEEGGRDKAKEILQNVHADFWVQPILLQKFNKDFNNFFDYLLDWSYGLELDRSNLGKPRFKKKKRTKDDERRMLEKVDLFCLVNYLIDNYHFKYKFSSDGDYTDFKLENIINTSQGEYMFYTSFSYNFWNNIFNDYDTYRGENQKEICLFNQAVHAIGSFLHTANPNIHYLHLTSSNTKKEPLATAILFEGLGKNTLQEHFKNYLIVEGVLGNFESVHTVSDRKLFYGFLWDSIKEYAKSKDIKNIFINTSHSGNQIEPEEFVEYVYYIEEIKQKTGLKGELSLDERGLRRFELKKPEKIFKENENIFFTHEFRLYVSSDSKKYANFSNNGYIYHDEQYADMFYKWSEKEYKKWEKGSFFGPQGYAQGFEVEVKQKEAIVEKMENVAIDSRPKQKHVPFLTTFLLSTTTTLTLGLYALMGLFTRYSPNETEIKEIEKTYDAMPADKLYDMFGSLLFGQSNVILDGQKLGYDFYASVVKSNESNVSDTKKYNLQFTAELKEIQIDSIKTKSLVYWLWPLNTYPFNLFIKPRLELYFDEKENGTERIGKEVKIYVKNVESGKGLIDLLYYPQLSQKLSERREQKNKQVKDTSTKEQFPLIPINECGQDPPPNQCTHSESYREPLSSSITQKEIRYTGSRITINGKIYFNPDKREVIKTTSYEIKKPTY